MLQFVLHLVGALAFAAISAGAFALIADQLYASRRMILAVLTGEMRIAAPRPWPSRVRLVSRSHPTTPRLVRQLRATA